ncbi:alpha/beta hydrolase [Sphingomonas montana]|uniref:alpha/beta hydrolase n=1 Tax=Sphingomonas montana TaxID=1843236 RepID=UPI00101AE950|nr:alpha/beta hydrolase [Sphingomonas montana]
MDLDRRALIAAGLAVTATAGAQPRPAAAASARFPIWPGRPPGSPATPVVDAVVRRSVDGPADDIAWPHVGTPMLTVTPAARPTGAAVLLVPGGGYTRVAVGRNGSAIAAWFAARGVTAFDLLYRLPHDGWAAGPDAPLQDAQRAMRLIRSQAARWRIDPVRVAALGFSAGGHLAARLAARSALATYAPIDAADGLSTRPIVAGLLYPVVTLTEPFAHGGSRKELFAGTPSPADLRRLSTDQDLPADMPPTFLAHAADDRVVKVDNSLLLHAALRRANVPAEMILYERGGHGFGLKRADGIAFTWPEQFVGWANTHGLGA